MAVVYFLVLLFITTTTTTWGALLLQQQEPNIGGDGDLVNAANDPAFLKCLDQYNCGIFNKCSFKLFGTAVNGSQSQSSANDPVVISGHIIMLKNNMPYSILFYWDTIGVEQETNSNMNSHVKYHPVLGSPNSISYIDTRVYGAHRIRLAVSTIGNSASLIDEPVDPSKLEFIQTMFTSDEECTHYQVCRLLDSVCYMASPNNADCLRYRLACSNFDDQDRVARESCIPECLYTYWTDSLTDLREIDSEKVVEWINRGGASVDGDVDGLCNTGAVAGLAIAFVLSLMGNFALIYLACTFKRNIKHVQYDTSKYAEYDNSTDASSDNYDTTVSNPKSNSKAGITSFFTNLFDSTTPSSKPKPTKQEDALYI